MNNLPVVTNSLDIYLTEIQKFPLLSAEEEYRLGKKWKEERDIKAAHTLITSNLRFVVKIAYEYRHYSLKLADLIQEGNIGLMKAVKKFDPDRGYRLISYAVWWIKAHIHNFIINSWSLVKIGTTQAQRKLFYKLNSIKNALGLSSEMLEEHIQELSEKLDIPEHEIREMDLRMAYRDFSLDAKDLENQNHPPLIESIATEEKNQEESIIEDEQNNLLKEGVKKVSNRLNEKERYILYNRLMADNPMTLEKIGEKFNITRERIRQIENNTKKKIKNYLEEYGVLPSPA